MSVGVIHTITKDRGFGFIKCGDVNQLFFHYSKIQDVPFTTLREGQNVRFKVSVTPKGLEAVNVKVVV